MTVHSLSNSMRAMSTGNDAGTEDAKSQSSTSATSASVDQNQFLTLLVAQLKNQDPMNPTDSSQFMGELAQFSTLQEVIGVHKDFDALLSAGGVTTS